MTTNNAEKMGKTLLDMCGQEPLPREEIESLIDQGADLNIQNDDGDTAVMLLLRRHDSLLARRIIKKGTNLHVINKNNENVLLVACRAGDRWSMDALYETGEKFDIYLRTTDREKTTALHECIRWDNGMSGRNFLLTNIFLKFGTPDIRIKDACAWDALSYIDPYDSPWMYKKMLQIEKDAKEQLEQSVKNVAISKNPIKKKTARFKKHR